MGKLIECIYAKNVEDSSELYEVDRKIEKALEKINSLYPDGMEEECEQLHFAIMEMLLETKKGMFVVGFRYAAKLWWEAVKDESHSY